MRSGVMRRVLAVFLAALLAAGGPIAMSAAAAPSHALAQIAHKNADHHGSLAACAARSNCIGLCCPIDIVHSEKSSVPGSPPFVRALLLEFPVVLLVVAVHERGPPPAISTI